MILVSLLVVSALISLSTSATHRRRDVEESSWNYAEVPEPWNSEQLYLYSILNAWTEAPKIDNNSDSSIDREKKMGSLSISNPMDVLRQRFILELARRQQLQQQQQIKANRELLKDIGKRSTQRLGIIYPRLETRNRQVLQRQPIASQVSSDYPNWSRMERLNWYNVGNSGDRNNEADQSSKLETNELRLL